MSTSPPISSFHDFDGSHPVTLADLASRFGDIPATRICLSPPPGQATEDDLLYYDDHEDRLFELVDGTLIEKTMGTYESHIAGMVYLAIALYLKQHPIGIYLPADGQLSIRRQTVRVPDVAFIAKDRVLQSDFPRARIASMSPNLAVEVISVSNSQKEMEDKLADYFATGTQEVWYVYPEKRELHQFSSPSEARVWQWDDSLETPLLPSFSLTLAEIFEIPLSASE